MYTDRETQTYRDTNVDMTATQRPTCMRQSSMQKETSDDDIQIRVKTCFVCRVCLGEDALKHACSWKIRVQMKQEYNSVEMMKRLFFTSINV